MKNLCKKINIGWCYCIERKKKTAFIAAVSFYEVLHGIAHWCIFKELWISSNLWPKTEFFKLYIQQLLSSLAIDNYTIVVPYIVDIINKNLQDFKRIFFTLHSCNFNALLNFYALNLLIVTASFKLSDGSKFN